MRLLPAYRPDLPRLTRFSLVTRIAHWGNAVMFLLCAASGLVIFLGSDRLAGIFGGMANASLVHRVSAVGLTAFILFYLFVGSRSIVSWLREVRSFGRDDIAFLRAFPGKLFGASVEIPPQSKLNGGEKLNSVLLSVSVAALVGTGYVIWFPDRLPAAMVAWSYLVHSVAMLVSVSLVCVHAYLGSLHPKTGEAFWGMLRGTVREDWAREHHGAWCGEIVGRHHETDSPGAPAQSEASGIRR